MSKRIFKAGLALIKNGKMLHVRAVDSDGYFFVPGGKIEKGETIEEALEREIKEELNVKIRKDSLKFLGTFEDVATTHPDRIVQIKLFGGEVDGELKPSGEVEELRWFGKDDDWSKLGTVAKTKIMPALVKMGLVK